jgi:hypothetical protein
LLVNSSNFIFARSLTKFYHLAQSTSEISIAKNYNKQKCSGRYTQIYQVTAFGAAWAVSSEAGFH